MSVSSRNSKIILRQLAERADEDEVLDLGTRSSQDLGGTVAVSLEGTFASKHGIGQSDSVPAGYNPETGAFIFLPPGSELDVDDLRVTVEDDDA